MKNKKMLIISLCIIIISTLVITTSAVVKYKYTSSSKEMVAETINRVDITVSATEFTYKNVSDDGMLSCSTVVSINKTEPDFYGKLHSITLSGSEFGYVIYTAGKNNGEAKLPEEVSLPCDEPLEWEITFTVPYIEGQDTYEINLDINYTTGLKTNTTQKYLTSIPLTLTVED